MAHDSLGSKAKSVFKRLLGAMRRRGPSPAPPAYSPATPSRPITGQVYAKRLETLLEEDRPLSAGMVQVVNLDMLRSHFGPKWNAVADLVHPLICRIIETQNGPGAQYCQTGEFEYTLLFSGLTAEQAHRKCALIGREVRERLIGEDQAYELIDVDTRAAEVTPGVIRHGESPSAGVARLLSEAQSEFHRQRLARSQDGALSPNLRFRYQPLWNAARKQVTTYMFSVSWVAPDGATLIGDSILQGRDDLGFVKALDTVMLDKVGRDLVALAAQKSRALVGVPVHYWTLSHVDSRREYLHAVKQIDEQVQRLLLFELIDAAGDRPLDMVNWVLGALKQLGRPILIRQRLDQRLAPGIGALGVGAVGASIDGLRWPERRVIDEMNGFVERASRERLRTYICGVHSLSLTTAAVGAGFDFINGDAVGPVVDSPQTTFSLDTWELYTRPAPAVHR